jgi:hypothetical protein
MAILIGNSKAASATAASLVDARRMRIIIGPRFYPAIARARAGLNRIASSA